MFEQVVLRPAHVRGWAVTLGFAGQLALVGCVLAVPLIWPQLLPRREVMSWIAEPLPPPLPIREATLPHVRPARPRFRSDAIWYPPHPTRQALPAFDEPPVPGTGVTGSTGSDQSGDTFGPVFDSVLPIETPKRPIEATAAPPKAVTASVQQIRVSGAIQAARLLYRLDPVYPALARQVRISGTVELAGVIASDGRIRELRVISGHPLLMHAALEAVRQWVYQPTLLNGNPVEVITTISVVFRLN